MCWGSRASPLQTWGRPSGSSASDGEHADGYRDFADLIGKLRVTAVPRGRSRAAGRLQFDVESDPVPQSLLRWRYRATGPLDLERPVGRRPDLPRPRRVASKCATRTAGCSMDCPDRPRQALAPRCWVQHQATTGRVGHQRSRGIGNGSRPCRSLAEAAWLGVPDAVEARTRILLLLLLRGAPNAALYVESLAAVLKKEADHVM